MAVEEDDKRRNEDRGKVEKGFSETMIKVR